MELSRDGKTSDGFWAEPGVDDSSRQAESWPKSVCLVWWLAITWWSSTFIR